MRSFASSAERRPSTLRSPLSANRIDRIMRIVGRLAGAVRADDAVEGALGHDQIEVSNGDGLAERLG